MKKYIKYFMVGMGNGAMTDTFFPHNSVMSWVSILILTILFIILDDETKVTNGL